MNLDPRCAAILTFVAHHRCATAGQLRFGAGLPWGSELMFKHTLLGLRSRGLLGLYRIPVHNQLVYHLTRRGLQALAELREPAEPLQPEPDENWAIHGWLRSQLHCVLSLKGWRVGRGAAAVVALRSWLLSASSHSEALVELLARSPLLQIPRVLRCDCGRTVVEPGAQARCPHCWTSVPYPATSLHRCRHCGFTSTEGVEFHERPQDGARCLRIARPDHLLPFDVAFRHRGDEPEVMLLLVDNLQRGIASQLAELPLHFRVRDPVTRQLEHPQKIRLMFVPCDDDSSFDPATNTWAKCGGRLRAVQKHFSDGPGMAFPLLKVAELVAPPASACWKVLRAKASPCEQTSHGLWQEEVCCDIKVA